MVDQQGIGALFDRSGNRREAGGGGSHDGADLVAAFDLQAIGCVIAKAVGLKKCIECVYEF